MNVAKYHTDKQTNKQKKKERSVATFGIFKNYRMASCVPLLVLHISRYMLEKSVIQKKIPDIIYAEVC